jgi:hypothetical protein
VNIEGIGLGDGKTDLAQRTSLGKQLMQRRDQVIRPYRIVFAGTQHSARR